MQQKKWNLQEKFWLAMLMAKDILKNTFSAVYLESWNKKLNFYLLH